MRILYLSPTGQMGGAETSLLTLMESLLAAHPDWQMILLLSHDGPLAVAATRVGVEVMLLPLPAELATLGRAARLSWRSLPGILQLLRAASLYRSEMIGLLERVKPDVLHSNGLKMHALLATIARRGGCARSVRVCHVHDYLRPGIFSRWLLRLGARRFDTIVANSRSVCESLLGFGIPAEKLRAIANGIDPARFTREGASVDLDRLSGLGPPAGEVMRVGLVATFARWKGHSTFLQALALLPENLNLRAYIIGGSIYQTAASQYTLADLEEAARQARPLCELGFTGWIAPIEEAYRALDILVHASTEPEPFGMVLIEAMACETPIIFSNAGGAAEICEDEVTALAYAPGDAAMLARQIIRLANDAVLRRTLATRGRATVLSRYQAGAVAKQFAELYATLCSLST